MRRQARIALLPALLVCAALMAGNARADQAQDDYQLHCMGCHGEDARGLSNQVPSLRESLGWLISSARGREFIQRVPGVSQSALNSERLAALLNWMVDSYADSTAARRSPPFTAREIEHLRRQPLLDVAAARAAL